MVIKNGRAKRFSVDIIYDNDKYTYGLEKMGKWNVGVEKDKKK